MVLQVIYVVRHGFRSNWVVDTTTGEYTASVRSPTGIASDPALASYGVQQAEELAEHLISLDPPIDVIYSSPFYRCIQTIKPTSDRLFAQGKAGGAIKVENGVGEFYGKARFDHPSPATLSILHTHFSNLDRSHQVILVPSTNGETIDTLHDRIAYTLHKIIARLDSDPSGPKSLLICTHAASMIAIGRALTGLMPSDFAEKDFNCFTCSLSIFKRRSNPDTASMETLPNVRDWELEHPDDIPTVEWRGGRGVGGGWECIRNGDCSFLKGGEERGWHFSVDESFLRDPNAYNDQINRDVVPIHTGSETGERTKDSPPEKNSRL